MANREQKEYLQQAFSGREVESSKKVNAVKDIYAQLGIGDIAQEEMKKYYAKAFDYLDIICQPDSRKQNLRDLAKSLFDRKK